MCIRTSESDLVHSVVLTSVLTEMAEGIGVTECTSDELNGAKEWKVSESDVDVGLGGYRD